MYVNNPNALVMLGELFNKGVVNTGVARADVAWRNTPSVTAAARAATLHLRLLNC